MEEELNDGKSYDLFHTNETSEKFIDNEGSNDREAEDRKQAFVRIYSQVQEFLSGMFKNVSYIVVVSTIIFGIFVLVIVYIKKRA